jgi:hypothetical protein
LENRQIRLKIDALREEREEKLDWEYNGDRVVQ